MSPTPDTRPQVKGWCPGAYAPMQSNDGLLMRAKIVGSRVSAAQLAEIAAIARDCGNGLVDLSQRAQLQLRGVTAETLQEALRRLDAIGLLARDADAERVTNIVASPLADLDPRVAFDANALARDLAQALIADEALRALPAKFLFAIDDGGALSVADVEADIHIEATPEGSVVRVAGAVDRAAIVTRDEAIPAALRLARAFVSLRAGDFELRRMKRLIAARGADAVFAEARLKTTPHNRAASPRRPWLGAQSAGGVFAGVAAPSGRFRAEELAALTELAKAEGVGDLRLTPWRAFLIPATSPDAAGRIVHAAQRLGLIVSHDDPRLAVVACPGAPECPQAQGETRAPLARLAPLAQKLAGADGVGLHISGCAKGCAHPGRTTVTLVARNSLYDLIENGCASDAPRLEGLTLDAVESALMRAEKNPCQI
jgi:precorrin-3B synthase